MTTIQSLASLAIMNYLEYLAILGFVFLARALRFLAKLLRKGSGTSLPGLLIEKYYPQILKPLAQKYSTIILISGTNGKTTTRSILAHLFRSNNQKICTNSGGANIYRGLASSILFDFNLLQNKPNSDTLILEVEEATLPRLSQYLKANYLILTNVFRDQLDVYGEIEQTGKYFETAINNLTQKSNLNLVFNAEDPQLVNLINRLDISKINLAGFELKVDVSQKPKFEGNLQALIPKYQLATADKIILDNNTSEFDFEYKNQKVHCELNLSGIYNIYNALGAMLVARDVLKLENFEALKSLTKVFGRGETVKIGSNTLQLFLVKNPAGFEQVLGSFKNRTKDKLIILINDNIADGRDVSWLWDTNFERYYENLQKSFESFKTGGSRGFDILLRLQMAGFDVKPEDNFQDLSQLQAQIKTSTNAHFTICATYTALLEIRKLIGTEVSLAAIDSSEF